MKKLAPYLVPVALAALGLVALGPLTGGRSLELGTIRGPEAEPSLAPPRSGVLIAHLLDRDGKEVDVLEVPTDKWDPSLPLLGIEGRDGRRYAAEDRYYPDSRIGYFRAETR